MDIEIHGAFLSGDVSSRTLNLIYSSFRVKSHCRWAVKPCDNEVVKTALATLDPPPVTHAPNCDGRCSPWLAIDAPSCQPYPCQCAKTKANRPEWADSSCWWIKKTTGRTVSRCPCWGMLRDGRPGACCAHHSANPRYALPPAPTTLDDLDVAPLVDWERPQRVDAALYDWSDPEEEFQPYERMWAPEDTTCPCVTPFDQDKRVTGWHCVSCHENFKSYSVGQQHRKRWTEPCRTPDSVKDVDTGNPLMYQDGNGVWGPLYPSAE